MKILLLLLLAIVQFYSFAQKPSTCNGNAPGHRNDWNWPGNWSNNNIPDEFTDVCIPYDNTALGNYPVIKSIEVNINSLFMTSGSILVLDDSQIHNRDSTKSFYKANQIIQRQKSVKWNEDITEIIYADGKIKI